MDFSSIALMAILEAVIISSSVSMDAFAASFAYGSNRIKIPMLSLQIINIICSSVLGLSFIAGTVIKNYIPAWLTTVICFIVLFVIGIIKLMDSITKSIIKKYNNLNKELRFSLFNFRFILNLYANPVEADIDSSKVISPTEAVSIALVLSLDSLAVGFGAALGNTNGLAVFICSFVIGTLAIVLGCYAGNKAAQKLPFNISWLGGVLLIILAVWQVF